MESYSEQSERLSELLIEAQKRAKIEKDSQQKQSEIMAQILSVYEESLKEFDTSASEESFYQNYQ